MIEEKTDSILDERAIHQLDAASSGSSDQFGSFNYYSALIPDELLEADEEQKLGKIVAESHDKEEVKEAKDKLVVYNIRWALALAKKFYFDMGMHGTLSLDDLVQAGIIGLMTAADRYDYKLGNRFTTYATHWIEQSIRRTVANEGATVRLPVHMHEFLTKYNKCKNQLKVDTDKEPMDEEVAVLLYDVLKVEEDFAKKNNREPTKADKAKLMDGVVKRCKEARGLTAQYQSMPSLDMFVGEENDSTLLDFVTEEDIPDCPVEDQALQSIYDESFKNAIKDVLPAREYQIISLRFGLKDGKVYTLNEVGEMMNPPITRERVRQLESKALLRLRRHPGIRKYLQTGSNDGSFFMDLGNYYEKIWTASGNLRAGVQPYTIESLISLIVHNTTYKRDAFIYDPKTISEVSQATKKDNLDAYYDLKRLRNSCKAILNARHKPNIER